VGDDSHALVPYHTLYFMRNYFGITLIGQWMYFGVEANIPACST